MQTECPARKFIRIGQRFAGRKAFFGSMHPAAAGEPLLPIECLVTLPGSQVTRAPQTVVRLNSGATKQKGDTSMSGKTKALLAGIVLSTSLIASTSSAVVTVGGEAMYPTKTIVENAVNSADHTTLVAAVQAAGLVEVLSSDGPFTVFAPVNTAFAALPPGTVDSLLQPANKAALTGVLTYHVLPARITYNDLRGLIDANGGSAELTTVAGGKLSFKMNGPVNIAVYDANGHMANITVYDVIQSNGVIHSIDQVLLPR